MEKTMTKKFAERLETYLESECDDYGLTYTWKWDEDTENCEVEVKKDTRVVSLFFRYDEEKDDLKIELCEDSFHTTREFDSSVKYFWMKISQSLFPNA